MNRMIPLLLCTALGACASPNSEPSNLATADAAVVQKPELRYYVISEA